MNQEDQPFGSVIEKAIKNDNLESLTIDAVDIGVNSIINYDALKDIPYFGLIVKSIRSIQSISNNILLKKIGIFLYSIKDIPLDERIAMMDKLEKSQRFNTKVGENLLYILNKCEDTQKARILGELFKSLISERITYKDFLKANKMINDILYEDLIVFVKSENPNLPDISNEDYKDYLRLGLLDDPKVTSHGIGGALSVSYIGKLLRRELSSFVKNISS